MRILVIQSAIFAAVFFVSVLFLKQGDLPGALLMTIAATAVYAVLTAILAGSRDERADRNR